jgi:type VI secretion system secreted protein VgrG
MSDAGLETIDLGFAAGKIRPTDVRLFGMRGREELSRLFSFDLYLGRDAGAFTDEELDTLFKVPCAIALGPDPGDVVRGVLARIRRLDLGGNLGGRYVAQMVPTAWLLTLAHTNRIFQNLTVPEIVASVLAHYHLEPERDYRIQVSGRSKKREYVVQYEESDWDFLQRWLEHEGLYYWFEHGGKNEVLVIADARDGTPPIAPPVGIRYRDRNTLSTGKDATVWDWELEQQRIPGSVAVFDYNYRTPATRLLAVATADQKTGFGTLMRYGEHFKTVDDGAALAKIRAERLASGRRVFSGKTDCSRFRVGHSFTLEDYDEVTENRPYLITSIDHAAGLPIPGAGDASGPRSYGAQFQAIPIDVQFRPEERTPWPSIHGVMHGHIAADGSGKFAEIDETGRYKVSLPFDSGNAKGAAVSRWIRMAQPSSGPGYGSHHPLHKGTEVLVAFIDGDPDRPIILASVPNAHTVGPVTKANLTQSVTRTASGIHLEMEDLATAGTTARGGKR